MRTDTAVKNGNKTENIELILAEKDRENETRNEQEKYTEMLHLIKECFLKGEFDPETFAFYQGRKNKSKFRAGMIKADKKYFFKILDKEEYNNEEHILERIAPFFCIMRSLAKLESDHIVISLYDYIDAPRMNSFNYLRDRRIPYAEKERKIHRYFTELMHNYEQNLSIREETQDSRGDRWFYGRYVRNRRPEEFYGADCSLLLADIQKYSTAMCETYRSFFAETAEFLNTKRNTIYTYSHGDLHDFNFSLDGLYWDNDTFDTNPIMNDLVVYYWHFNAREDYLIYKYSPWLTNYMYDSLDPRERQRVRNRKKEEIQDFYHFVKDKFVRNHLDFADEFRFKLFCRVFLIDNVLTYDEEDKKAIYEYFFRVISADNLEAVIFHNAFITRTYKGNEDKTADIQSVVASTGHKTAEIRKTPREADHPGQEPSEVDCEQTPKDSIDRTSRSQDASGNRRKQKMRGRSSSNSGRKSLPKLYRQPQPYT